MQRVFARDVLECPSCSGRMRVVAAIEPPEIVCAIVRCLGLASRALFCDPDFELVDAANDPTPPPSD